jgi:hypothetical protein
MLLVKKITSCRLLPVLSLSLFFSACTGKSNNEEAIIKALEESLESSTNSINMSSTSIMKTLEEKTTEWATREKANIWFPKAELIADFARIRFTVIEKKKKKQEINDSDLNEVYQTLIEYKKEVLGRDSSLKVEFEGNFTFIKRFIYLVSVDTSKSFLTLNKSISKEYLNAVMTSLQNEITKVENKTIAYCNEKVGSTIDYFDSYSTIIGQNSTILRAGEYLEINAGVGAFSRASQPKIIINNNLFEINENGYATYKVKVGNKQGNYKIPVNIAFMNYITGKSEEHQINVEYTVAKKCN